MSQLLAQLILLVLMMVVGYEGSGTKSPPVAGIFNNLPRISFGADSGGVVSFVRSGCWLTIYPGISFFRSGSQYNRLVDDDGIMQLAQAGIYQGPAAIQEYGSFLTETSPFIQKAEQTKVEIRYMGLVRADTSTAKKEDQCIFDVGINWYHLHDETTCAYRAEYDYPIMFKAFFPVGKKAQRINVYFANGFFEQVFTRILDSDNTRRTICDVYNNQTLCAASGILQEANVDCASMIQSLPVSAGSTSHFRIDGNFQGCRALHAAFSITNPTTHCPHISFAPQPDSHGKTTCQTSLGVTPDDLFDEEDFTFWKEYCVKHGFDPDIGFREIVSL
jgi:hypothetical protein